jgi:hypothetical protein
VGADPFASPLKFVAATALVAGLGVLAGGSVARAADPPSSPYGGRLAKAVFLSDDVGAAIAALAAGGGSPAPAPAKAMLSEAAARARQAEPKLADPPGANPIVTARLARQRAVAQGMVALVASPEARAESVTASEALVTVAAPSVESAMGAEVPLGLAEVAEGYLKAHRESALTAYLYPYLMVQYRLAFERQAAAKALEGQKTSAKKYRAFLLRAKAAADPLLKAVADDIDAQLYLQRPIPDHPRDFDPDACCRDK